MPRVLIADDEDSMRSLVARAIAMDGHETVTAQDGAEALEVLTRDEGAFALIGEARHQQDLQVGKIARHRQSQCDAVHHGHLDVGQQQVERALFAGQDIEGFGAVLGGDGLVAVHGDGARHQRAHRILVIGNQHARH